MILETAHSRRQYIKTIGTATFAVSGGCLRLQNQNTETDQTEDTETTPDKSTPGESTPRDASTQVLNADFEYSPVNPGVGDQVTLDASPSAAPDDQEIIEYHWVILDEEGNVEQPIGRGEQIQHTFESSGRYHIGLQVDDNEGHRDRTSQFISVDSADQSQISSVDGSWTQYGHNPPNTGFVPGERGPTDTVSENFRLKTDQPASSAPIVADGRVFFTSGNDLLYAIDAVTGEEIWSIEAPGIGGQDPVYADSNIFVASTEGKVFSINSTSGSYIWQTNIGQVPRYNPPRVVENRLFVTDQLGIAYGVSLGDGSILWRTELSGLSLGGPAISDDRVLTTSMRPEDGYPSQTQSYHFFESNLDEEPVTSLVEMDTAGGSVYALSMADGNVVWEKELPDFVVATPTVSDGTVYVGCWDNHLYALSVSSGNQQWRYNIGAPISGSASVSDDSVVVGSWEGSLHSITFDGSREWILPNRDGDIITSKPCITEEMIYVAIDDGPVVGVTRDGVLNWSFAGPVGDFDSSEPVVIDNVLYVCGDTGTREEKGEVVDTGGIFSLI